MTSAFKHTSSTSTAFNLGAWSKNNAKITRDTLHVYNFLTIGCMHKTILITDFCIYLIPFVCTVSLKTQINAVLKAWDSVNEFLHCTMHVQPTHGSDALQKCPSLTNTYSYNKYHTFIISRNDRF